MVRGGVPGQGLKVVVGMGRKRIMSLAQGGGTGSWPSSAPGRRCFRGKEGPISKDAWLQAWVLVPGPVLFSNAGSRI